MAKSFDSKNPLFSVVYVTVRAGHTNCGESQVFTLDLFQAPNVSLTVIPYLKRHDPSRNPSKTSPLDYPPY